MERERLGRLLSLALVPCGLVMLLLALLVGEVVPAAIGVIGVVLGLALYRGADVLFDADAEFDLRGEQSLLTVLTQLVLTLVMFGLLAYLIGDVRAVTALFRTGVGSPTAAAVAVVVGVALGGGVAALTQRSDALAERSQSPAVRTVGSSLTLGSFVALLLLQPPSSLIYVVAYTLSRVAVVFGIYLRS